MAGNEEKNPHRCTLPIPAERFFAASRNRVSFRDVSVVDQAKLDL
jgi:hypothetical protein